MSNNLGQNNGDRIEKPYEPDITKGATSSDAPTKPQAPTPQPTKPK